jgi:hypothetical protein
MGYPGFKQMLCVLEFYSRTVHHQKRRYAGGLAGFGESLCHRNELSGCVPGGACALITASAPFCA